MANTRDDKTKYDSRNDHRAQGNETAQFGLAVGLDQEYTQVIDKGGFERRLQIPIKIIEAGQKVVSAGGFKLRNGISVIENNNLVPKPSENPRPTDA